MSQLGGKAERKVEGGRLFKGIVEGEKQGKRREELVAKARNNKGTLQKKMKL